MERRAEAENQLWLMETQSSKLCTWSGQNKGRWKLVRSWGCVGWGLDDGRDRGGFGLGGSGLLLHLVVPARRHEDDLTGPLHHIRAHRQRLL